MSAIALLNSQAIRSMVEQGGSPNYLSQEYVIIINKMRISGARLFRLSTVKEWIDSQQQINTKIKTLANAIVNSKHAIFFTGAGCSTSVGIPDYRSGVNTVVDTGPGIWNRTQQQIQSVNKLKIDEIVDNAVPSLTHMAVKTLLNRGLFKYLVSQNTDGLHVRSGVRFDQIAELHGNRNVEKCIKCHRKYFRDFRTIKRGVRSESGQHNHETGRYCQNCDGNLVDSIVYFGQKLPKQDLTNAFQQAATCDLLLCIGSSLTVRPSGNVPVLALKNNAKLCIINIQQTPLDGSTFLKINGFCDAVMRGLMNELKIPIAPYQIQHRLELSIHNNVLQIVGKDNQDNNYSFIKSVIVDNNDNMVLVPAAHEGHTVRIPLHETELPHQIFINLFGNKDGFELYPPAFYELHLGEKVTIKAIKKQSEAKWHIQEQSNNW